MNDSPREARIDSWTRGIVIAALIVVYGWFVGHPQGSFKQMFVVGVLLQVAVIFVRTLVPAANQPRAQYIFEMVADGVTVLTFALGVFGGITRISDAA